MDVWSFKYQLFKKQVWPTQQTSSVDILMETKLNDSFPEGQFLIEGFHSPFRFDCNWGIKLYVREDILTKLLSQYFPWAESFFVEIMLYKKKWLINCSYNPHKNNIENHLDIISRSLDTDFTKYENIVLLDDFIVCVNDEALKTFCKPYSFSSLIKQATCFKNSKNPSCIDLMLRNKPHSFQKKCVIETGLSDFHRMTIFVLKMHFQKLPPKRINYIGILKNLTMKGLWIPYYILSMKNVMIIVKTLTDFLKFVMPYLILMHLKSKRYAWE